MLKRLVPSLAAAALGLLILSWRLPAILASTETFLEERFQAALERAAAKLGAPVPGGTQPAPKAGTRLSNGMILFTPDADALAESDRIRIERRAVALAPLEPDPHATNTGEPVSTATHAIGTGAAAPLGALGGIPPGILDELPDDLDLSEDPHKLIRSLLEDTEETGDDR